MIMIKMRTAILILGSLLSLQHAYAQSWTPNKPLRLIVPQVAGGGADAIGRVIAHGISEQTGQPVMVDNRPGVNGAIGVEALTRSPTDGYSLLLVFTSLMALNPAVYSKLSYDPLKDLTPLGGICEVPLVVMASPSVNANNAVELVAADKARPKSIFAASSGNGAFSHLLLEMMNAKTGTTFTHIPFKGEAPAVQNLMSDQSMIIYIGTPALAIANQNSGKLKLLAVTTRQRMPQLPEVKTLAEQGYGDFDESFWYGVVAANGTPQIIVDAYNKIIGDVARSATVQTNLGRLGCAPLPMSSAAFNERIKTDFNKYATIAKSVGMKVE
ncbi:MAG: tripartite tricarboxylate transporter substrate binding protein [Proteobacteria bacterium]|nr:tripartite tricarboxylate transporter substrate binding protein [Pseudomonadota bacterium]